MAITKSDKTFINLTKHELSDNSQLRLFDVLLDGDRTTYLLNIFKSFEYSGNTILDTAFYFTHEVDFGEFWDTISNKYYNTPHLWWAVASFNNVVNPFEELTVGDNIKILKPSYIYSLVRDIENISGM